MIPQTTERRNDLERGIGRNLQRASIPQYPEGPPSNIPTDYDDNQFLPKNESPRNEQSILESQVINNEASCYGGGSHYGNKA